MAISNFRSSLVLPVLRLVAALSLMAFPASLIAAEEELEDSPSQSAPQAPKVEQPSPAAPEPMPAVQPTPPSAASDSQPATGTPPAPGSQPSAEAPSPAADTAKPSTGAVQSAAPAPTPASVDAGPSADTAAGPAFESQGPGELTIEVDERQSRNEGKSLPLALLYSTVLPGTGELYLGEKGKAKTFLLIEAGFWASLYISYMAKDSYLQSARNHASHYAGIDASGKSENFLETMAAYRAYQEKQHRQDSYELAQVLSGKREQDFDIKPLPENYWDFGSSANPENTDAWREFQSTMRFYRASKVAVSFSLGALALNRLASLVNTLQLYKSTSAKRVSWDLVPDLGPGYAASHLVVRF